MVWDMVCCHFLSVDNMLVYSTITQVLFEQSFQYFNTLIHHTKKFWIDFEDSIILLNQEVRVLGCGRIRHHQEVVLYLMLI